jgi:hypothetical protein
MEISSGSPLWQARWREEAPRPALVRFVLLSMLLHATLVILFGTSHGGGAGRGETVLDALEVTLGRQPALPDSGFRPRADASPDAGRDLLRHDELAPAVPKPPRTEPNTAPPIEPPVVSPESKQEQHEAAPTIQERRIEPLPRIDLRAPQEVDKPLAPPLMESPPIERLAPPPNPPPLPAPLELAPRTETFIPAAPLDSMAAPAKPRELAPPLELKPRPPLPIPEAPIERMPTPPAARGLAPPLELKPNPSLPIPEAPIERMPTPPAAHELAPPLELPPPAAPVVPAPLERMTTPRLEHDLAPPPTLIAPAPAAPAVSPPPTSIAPQVERTAPPTSAPPPAASATPTTPVKPAAAAPATAPAANAAPATAAEPPRLRLGAPPPDEDIFKPRGDVVTPDQSGGEHIDMDAARKRAREIAGEATSTRGILPSLPLPPEKKSKESLALEKAMKPDCRTAYAGMGLLAVPALVVSTIGDGGCRW